MTAHGGPDRHQAAAIATASDALRALHPEAQPIDVRVPAPRFDVLLRVSTVKRPATRAREEMKIDAVRCATDVDAVAPVLEPTGLSGILAQVWRPQRHSVPIHS